jgi:hypothetical protein
LFQPLISCDALFIAARELSRIPNLLHRRAR